MLSGLMQTYLIVFLKALFWDPCCLPYICYPWLYLLRTSKGKQEADLNAVYNAYVTSINDAVPVPDHQRSHSPKLITVTLIPI